MSSLFQFPFNPALNVAGLPAGAATMTFYLTGTSTLQTVRDASGDPLTNPVTADASGRFPQIYLDESVVYRVVLKDVTGSIMPNGDIDPYTPASAATLNFLQSGTGANARTVQTKLRETISVTDYMGVLSTAAAIQAAVDYASGVGAVVHFPAGTYTVTPATLAPGYIGDASFGTTLKYAIQMKSNVRFVGDGAVIKVADNVSSRASPQNFAVFYSEAALSNVQFDGLTIDLNGQNNYFSPDPTNTGLTQSQRYKRYHQAAIFWEGTGGKADDVTISRCTFKNSGGVSVIICGRVGAAGTGRRWRVNDCTFLEMGLDSYDHSSIYLWCDDANVTGCFWRNTLQYSPTAANLAGMNSAIEIHGSNTIVEGNTIGQGNRGIFLTENSFGRVQRQVVRGNILYDMKFCAIDIAFDGSGGFGGPRLLEVTDNVIDMLADDTNLDNTTIPAGIQYNGLDSMIAPVESLIIARNEMKRGASGSGRSCEGVRISLVGAAGSGMIDVIGNGASGFTRGFNLITNSTTTIEKLNLKGNRWRNPSGGTIPAVTKVGARLFLQGGTINAVTIDDEITDTRSSNSWAFGLSIEKSSGTTTVTKLEVGAMEFDHRLAFADRIAVSGGGTLTVARQLGVPVSGTFPAGSIAASTAVTQTAAIPGVTADDRIVLSGFSPANGANFNRSAYYTTTNTVVVRLANDTASGSDPGSTAFFVTNHAR